MKISSQWLEGRCFVASNGSGHSVVMDGNGSEAGSLKRGVSPMEMLLMGVAGCSSIDVVEILKKQRQNVHHIWGAGQDCPRKCNLRLP